MCSKDYVNGPTEGVECGPVIKAATNHYIDDIIINEDSVSVHQVAERLRYGLETEVLDNARVLGLQLSRPLQGVAFYMWEACGTFPRSWLATGGMQLY